MPLTILGTSHIAKQSLNEVRKMVQKEGCDIVALELDSMRLYALLHKKNTRGASLRDIRQIGFKGYLFSLLGSWAERRLGQMVGVKPGSEMLTAYRLAKKQRIQVALIDQRIEITLKKLSESLSWKEKWNFLVDIVKGIFKRESLEFDLTTVPSKEIVRKMTSRVRDRYPNFYRVLVTDRNKVMARNLAELILRNPDKRILAIVGAGHEEELMSLVKEGTNGSIRYSISIG